MTSKDQKAVETTDTTTEIAETITSEEQQQQTEISEPTTTIISNTVIDNNAALTNSKSKKKFVVGTEESSKDNRENNDSTSPQEKNVMPTDAKEIVESNMDTKSWVEEVAKASEEERKPQQPQSESDEEPSNENNKNNTNAKEALAIQTQINSEPQQPIQQPTPKEEKVNDMNSKPITMTPTEAHQAAPVVTNTTVTAITQRQPTTSAPSVKQPAKFILSTPAESPDSTPISSPSDGIHNASFVNNSSLLRFVPNQSSTQPNYILDGYNTFPSTIDDSYTSESLNYPHQPRFPPSSGGISRTQQKLLLQRQHFLADDENYLIHPRNQLRLTKVIERINREHAGILLYKDPIIESLQRVWPKYVQEHPEVLEDDFGVGYEDAKEWGVISDNGKGVDHIRSNSIISTETLGVDSMPLRGIK